MAEDGQKVSLNIYDLSHGLARQLSTTFLGKAIEGIWHTGVVVYGNEYFFGGGIQVAPAGATQYGNPIQVVDLGFTHVPKELFEEYLQEISPRYTAETYSLLKHNCNNFSNEVAQFLVGTNIPDYILQLPNDVLSSPMGALILPMIQQLEETMRTGAVPQAPQFRPTSSSQPPSFMSTTVHSANGFTTTTISPESRSTVDVKVRIEEIPDKPGVVSGKAFENGTKTETVRTWIENDTEAATTRSPEETPKKAIKASENGTKAATTQSAEVIPKKATNGVVGDPLGDARSKIQEEITHEFKAIMATGTTSASEAAAQAARKVMQRHGKLN